MEPINIPTFVNLEETNEVLTVHNFPTEKRAKKTDCFLKYISEFSCQKSYKCHLICQVRQT